jgi:hypothetical protein
MFEITKTEIKNLSDQDLRNLIGLLCEATLSKYNMSPKSVYYGGNQDAKDDGVDVLIKHNHKFSFDDFISNSNTVIQVKKSNMPPKNIRNELEPKGKLREFFLDLQRNQGAYIIVSSHSDVTFHELNRRESTIKECLSEIDPECTISYAFYDCNKIVSWVNQFPSLCIWVQNRNGLSVTGWQSFNDWTFQDKSYKQEIILNEESFIFRNAYDDENKLDMISAIQEIRELLAISGNVVRLAGLSGVGKTRFAYSIFSNDFENIILNNSLLLYCDISNNPNPEPITMVNYLLKLGKRVVLVVDNCEKNMHSQLTELCKSEKSEISLLTIEFDAKEDDLIETTNYYMTVSSDKTIEKYIKNNFNYINHSNLQTIIEMSGGNFRMAKYLSSSLDKIHSIGILNSSQILDRLFMNGKNLNMQLAKTADVCSLLFSFNIETELDYFASLSGISTRDLYENINILVDMKFIQVRRKMRAVLPHALANTLAIRFLKSAKSSDIINALIGNDRVFLSFSRRLKFLHTSKEAKEVACLLLENYELFRNFENINSSRMEIIYNLTYVIPEIIKHKIISITDVNFFTKNNKNYNIYVNILLFLSYESTGFEDVIARLFDFACSEEIGDNYNSIRDRVDNLFHLILSGTHATVDQRLIAIKSLLISNNSIRSNLGIHLINEMLKTTSFIAYNFDFGSMKRDYGYHPKTNLDQYEWYFKVLEFCTYYLNVIRFRDSIKMLISNNFRSLAKIGLLDELDKIIRNVIIDDTWPEIWVSIHVALQFDKEIIPEKIISKLQNLLDLTKPSNLIDEFKVYVSSNNQIFYTIDDIDLEINENSKSAYTIGQRFGENTDLLQENLSLLVETGNNRLLDFGSGLVNSNTPFEILFNIIFNYIISSKSDVRPIIIKGMLRGINNYKKIIISSLQNVLSNNKTKNYFPYLLSAVKVDSDYIVLIKQALADGSIPLYYFKDIVFALDNLTSEEIIDLLNFIPITNEGIELRIDILASLISNNKFDDKLFEISANSLSFYDFSINFSKNSHINYEFTIVSKKVFTSKEFVRQAIIVLEKINNSLSTGFISFYDISSVLKPIIENYSSQFLDIFFQNESDLSNIYKKNFLNGNFEDNQGPLSIINEGILIEWVENTGKYEFLLKYSNLFSKIKNEYAWTKLGSIYISRAESTSNLVIIESLVDRLYPNSWEGSLADILTSRLKLIEIITYSQNDEVSELAKNLLTEMKDTIYFEKKHYEERNMDRFGLFEL